MALFDAYRSPAELRKLYLHCQYLTHGSSALRTRRSHTARVAAAFLRAAIDIPASGDANNRRQLLQAIARLAVAIWQGVEGAQDTAVLFVDCLLGTANYQLPTDDRDQAVAKPHEALNSGEVSQVAGALRYWK